MAEPKRQYSLEAVSGVTLLIVVIAFIFYMFARSVLPGLAPVAVQGASLAKPSDLIFYAIAGLAIVSAAVVAFSHNVIYSALGLLGALLGTGALYVFLNADYVAVTQVLIYIGGVLVLILFAVMLTSHIGDKSLSNPSNAVAPGLVLLAGLLGVLGYVSVRAPWKVGEESLSQSQTARTLGDLFLKEYLLPFEVSSLVLVATLIGAVVVARKEVKE